MKAILNYKVLAILEIVFALIGLENAFFIDSSSIDSLRRWQALLTPSIYTIIQLEAVICSLLGILGGYLLFKRNKKGIIISRIWAVLQIPLLLFVSPNFFVVFIFPQFLTLTLHGSSYDTNFNMITKQLQLESLTFAGINIVGIILLLLFWKIRFPSKK